MGIDVAALDEWCAERIEKLLTGMETYIMSGGKPNNPNYRQQLGQHQAYSAMRSFISGSKRATPKQDTPND